MALVSPGLQLTVTDESQYIPSAVGTVPLVILATAENKTINGSLATGTTASNAGKLQIFGSQRELVSALGYPSFKQSSAGTPLHGNELNEYGLMASYSTLGLGNRAYVVRADIDLDQLIGTSVRPKGEVADGTQWLDLANTDWGMFEWSASTQSFVAITPILVTSVADTDGVDQDGFINESTPRNSIGQIGSYAVVATTINNRLFYKAGADIGTIDPNELANTWVLIGSSNWYASSPVLVGTRTNPVITTGGSITINTIAVTVTGVNASAAAAAINSASIPGITADILNGKIAIYSDGSSTSNGSIVDGKVKVATSTLVTELGLTGSTTAYNGKDVQYSSYAVVPSWGTTDSQPSPTRSIWLKTSSIGGGASFVFKKYNASTATWISQNAPAQFDEAYAINALDPVAGGSNIAEGAIFLKQSISSAAAGGFYGGYTPYIRTVSGQVKAVGEVPADDFVDGDSFTLTTTQPGTNSTTSYTITVNGTGVTDFVTSILAANIPNVTAQVETNGAISITHLTGGTITLAAIAGNQDIPSVAGFVGGVTNVTIDADDTVIISGFRSLTYTYSISQPYADPIDGTLWYYNDPTQVDIMINTGAAWRGYRNVTADARGYNLSNTDPAGVIVSASRPTTQTDNSALVAGDLWLDTSDLENWPKLSRYNGRSWAAIDNTDQITQSGVVFGDARWDVAGIADPATGTQATVISLLTSDYTDLDAPDARLYPRGTLLFNTRRSGYNVKRFIGDYFNVSTFNVNNWSSSTSYVQGNKVIYGTTVYVALTGIGAAGDEPDINSDWGVLETGAWVTASGLKNNGSPFAGHQAQRAMIVTAMQAAIDSNTQIREDQFQFNLIVAPGYPELIDNMVALNNDRANTAFVIGDTPMSLSTNVVELTNWSNNTNGDGLATNDPYLGVYYPSGISNDVQGNTIMVPSSHMALRTFLHNDNVSFQWFAPAGTRRGMVDNAVDLGYLDTATGEFVRTGVNQALRDSLYSININPICIITGIGLVVWGQKTRNPVSSAMDRVNVARLVNYIRTILAKSGNGFLFEPNDKITRDQFKQMIESAINDLVAKRGIYDYLVVCDTSNNTPDRIARNELYVDIAIEPMKGVEFIYIPIRLMNPGAIATLGS